LIREATEDDVGALVALSLDVQRLHIDAEPERFVEPSREAVAEWWVGRLREDDWHALVAEVDGRCRGYLLFELIDRPAGIFTAARRAVYVHHIGVDPAVRRHGIGRELLEAVAREASAIGAQEVALDTWSFNATAQAFFASCGYEVCNVRLRRRV
jgi:diamine N-acetyltransferase